MEEFKALNSHQTLRTGREARSGTTRAHTPHMLQRGSRVALLVASLAALAGSSASQPQSVSLNSSYAMQLSLANAANVTRGAVIRCACETILRDEGVRTAPVNVGNGTLVWYNGPDSLGDGFGSLLPNATDTIRQILAAPLNDTAIRVPASALSGVNVWALNKVAEMGQFEVEFFVVRLNPAAWASGDKIRQAQIIFNQGFDCLWSATLVQPDRLPHMRFMQVSQPYGFTVVARGPTGPPDIPIRERLFLWTRPFTKGVWGLIFASLGFAGSIMVVFEAGNFRREHSLPLRVYAGFHHALRGFCQTGYFEPVTRAGISFSMGFALFLFLIAAAYVANLTNFFLSAEQPVLAISSVADFAAKGVPLCVANDAAHRSWVAGAFPELAARGLVRVVNGSTASALVREVAAGRCQGGVSTDVHVRHALGPLDRACEFSSVLPVGHPLSSGFYAIAFTPSPTLNPASRTASATEAFVLAAGTLFSFPLQTGAYQAAADAAFPKVDALCAYTAAGGAGGAVGAGAGAGVAARSLSVWDLCGVFLLQAAGLFLAFLAKIADFCACRMRKLGGQPGGSYKVADVSTVAKAAAAANANANGGGGNAGAGLGHQQSLFAKVAMAAVAANNGQQAAQQGPWGWDGGYQPAGGGYLDPSTHQLADAAAGASSVIGGDWRAPINGGGGTLMTKAQRLAQWRAEHPQQTAQMDAADAAEAAAAAAEAAAAAQRQQQALLPGGPAAPPIPQFAYQ